MAREICPVRLQLPVSQPAATSGYQVVTHGGSERGLLTL